MAAKSSKPKKTSQSEKHVEEQKAQRQNVRERLGVLLILAAIYAALCCLRTKAFLIAPCAALIGGLFGQIGRYLLPVLLVAAAVMLFKSKNEPMRLRMFCLLMLLITLPGFIHILYESFSGNEIPLNLKILYNGGKDWTTGGVLPGTVAEIVEAAITRIGAIITFLLAILLQALYCVGITVNSLINAIKSRPRIPVQKKPEQEEREVDPAKRLVNHVQNKRIERYTRKHNTPISEYDLEIDDPPLLSQKDNRETASKGDGEPQNMDIIGTETKQVTIDEIELHEPTESTARKKQTEPVPQTVRKDETEEARIADTQPVEMQQPMTDKLKRGEAAAQAQEISQEIEQSADSAMPDYRFPALSLLELRKQSTVDATSEMRENTRLLSETLKSFGIEPHIVNVIRGPSVTRYELEIDRGVKLSKITNLSDDIALSLGATGVRISAIPDKISVVGIEVPNKAVSTVFAREVIDSPAFRNSKSKLSFAVGKDISGNCIIGDIGKLPHMLIAGTTGSGKSVCMNTLILSLLYKAKPDEVKLIMVDPKMVELGVYNGIPHLLIPVVTDPKKAAGALQWTVTEMMRRYRLMSDEGVRDLESYNKAISGDPDQQAMPQIVVVIDELADLMMAAAKEVEEAICRIAQMGRASGIHLVIATQRPSADVITGLMKANIPSRIAFAVSSALDSRIILDATGAEKLVGKGDMLYAPLGLGKPKRVQGCFITDQEVQAVVGAIKQQAKSDYSADIIEQIEKRSEQTGKGGSDSGHGTPESGSSDELLPAAVEVILETGQASVSMLQRRLKLGYARAARIVDEMEERGIVGPFEGAKPRQLLITKDQWIQMQNGSYHPNPPVEEEIP